MAHSSILIFDFGSQYTQLIARCVREMQVYCEILPWHKINEIDFTDENIKGVILSGSPYSVRQEDAPKPDLSRIQGLKPILGVCYGAQLLAQNAGGTVSPSDMREYGRAQISLISASDLFSGLSNPTEVWMSHADTIAEIPDSFELIATTTSIPVAAFKIASEPTYGIQFHPEVTHSKEGRILLKNFVINICSCIQDFTPQHFIEETVADLKKKLKQENVVMALSGGVDSTVAAVLLHKAIGSQLHCIVVDNGLMRKNEMNEVIENYKHLGLNIKAVDAKQQFYSALKGVAEPEEKRKIIGRTFIEIFDQEAHHIVEDINWLGQGTIYPDVIESVSVNGPSATIKSHHNVGGLPEKMHMKMVEPLRMLFKDEVRKVGAALGIDNNLLKRHPFPGPGLGVRILGDITEAKVKTLQEADAIYIDNLLESGWYDKIWQAGAILTPIKSVGVMGDERTYENVVALRAVHSSDGMTADWVHIPYEVLAKISSEIINRVKGVNRVVYDISSKPPATIEWE
jgi:GMP synthase (glutamine-hydrolysing)